MPTDTLHDALESEVGALALQLRSRDHATGATVLRSATEAVRDCVRDGSPLPRVSPVAPLPDGPVLRIDDLPRDAPTRRRIADAIGSLVTEAGLDPEVVVVLDLDGLADLDDCRRAVVLRLFPPPARAAGRLPHAWIDLAAEWVFGGHEPDSLVRLRVLGVEATAAVKDAAGILHGCAAVRTWCDAVTGDLTDRVRTASISFGLAPHVALAGGGPRCDDSGLLARHGLLAEVARDCADAAYAAIDFEETFEDLGTGLSHAPWAAEGGASPGRVAGRLVDRHVPEVFPFQVLGAGHAAAFDTLPSGSKPLDERRWQLEIGPLTDWLPGSANRDEARSEGWDRLAPLLLRADELDGALAEAGADDVGEAARSSSLAVEDRFAAGLPDFDTLVIEPHSHVRRGTRLTVLELAAWLSGEPHSDAPTSVSPVLRNYVRELAVGLDDGRRQDLGHLAATLIGTGHGDDAAEQARCWLLADRLLRCHAPAWLRAAGLTESADRLAGLGPIEDDTQLVRGVDLLGTAAATASRRLEITLSIAGDRAHVVEALAWEAWEDAAQRSGWAAAADSVGHGIPGDLTFATDQRVMECSRDPEQRSQLESSTRGLGDEVWSTALQEIAATAWRSAWHHAEAFVHHESTFSVRTTLRRSLQHLLPDADAVGIDMLLDDVDTSAREILARLILVGDDQSDYLQKGITAGSQVEGGDAWRQALGETRRVLGPQLFDDAIDTARVELGDWAHRAPRLVSRAVVASITREACSVAGRGVAGRAAAEALARTGSEVEAEAAGRRATEAQVATLADDALALVPVLAELRG